MSLSYRLLSKKSNHTFVENKNSRNSCYLVIMIMTLCSKSWVNLSTDMESNNACVQSQSSLKLPCKLQRD